MARKASSANQSRLMLVNVMEEIVKAKVKLIMKELGACTCDLCYLNACALALNELKPKYVTTTKGALLSQVTATQLDEKTGILVAVTKAVKLVMQTPRH